MGQDSCATELGRPMSRFAPECALSSYMATNVASVTQLHAGKTLLPPLFLRQAIRVIAWKASLCAWRQRKSARLIRLKAFQLSTTEWTLPCPHTKPQARNGLKLKGRPTSRQLRTSTWSQASTTKLPAAKPSTCIRECWSQGPIWWSSLTSSTLWAENTQGNSFTASQTRTLKACEIGTHELTNEDLCLRLNPIYKDTNWTSNYPNEYRKWWDSFFLSN